MGSTHNITRILREIASETKTSAGDHWSTDWCNDAADYIDKLRSRKTLFVCHMEDTIMKIGTRDECQAHKDAQHFNTYCWHVNTMEDYGSFCFNEGFESAAAQGATQGPEY